MTSGLMAKRSPGSTFRRPSPASPTSRRRPISGLSRSNVSRQGADTGRPSGCCERVPSCGQPRPSPRSASQARYDTTNEEWGPSSGQDWGLGTGHQWDCFMATDRHERPRPGPVYPSHATFHATQRPESQCIAMGPNALPEPSMSQRTAEGRGWIPRLPGET